MQKHTHSVCLITTRASIYIRSVLLTLYGNSRNHQQVETLCTIRFKCQFDISWYTECYLFGECDFSYFVLHFLYNKKIPLIHDEYRVENFFNSLKDIWKLQYIIRIIIRELVNNIFDENKANCLLKKNSICRS